jgi:hypothetical protein
LSGSLPPPPSLRFAVTAGLLGAFLLARGDKRGMALMESTPEGAGRSFMAAAICLPAFLALRFFTWSEMPATDDIFGRPLLAELIGFVFAWTAFALASRPILQSWGQLAAWPRFIAAWNWSNVVQYLVLLLLALLGALGLPAALAQVLLLIGLAYAIWIEWFVVRSALNVGGLQAAALVGLDFALGLFLSGLVQRLSV